MSAQTKLAALDIGQILWEGAQSTAKGLSDATQWVGGALAGEFNTQATVGQIVVDAVISMFPIAGEVTAARDATAITLRMSESEEAANDTWHWVSLVLCLLAVVPVLGGVLKGVGRLVVRAASKSEDLVKLGQEILAFLRKMGYGDAYAWLKALDFAKYQDEVMSAFYKLLRYLETTSDFVLRKMSAVIPPAIQTRLRQLPIQTAKLRELSSRKLPQAFKDLNALLNRVREKLVDGSYIAAINTTGKEARVMVTEGRMVVQKAITGPVAHPPAALSQYKHIEGWPDLKEQGEAVLRKQGLSEEEIRETVKSGHLWPINTFSGKAPIVAHTGKPGDGLYRILDRTPDFVRRGGLEKAPKHTLDRHRAGDCWSPTLPANGKEFRTRLAVKHAWNANGFYERLTIPTRQQMLDKGIAVPPDWQGLRTWRGTVGGQLDVEEKIESGLKHTNTWLEGGGAQDFIDWDHPHNDPVRQYLLKTVLVKPTGWTDLQLPVNRSSNLPHVVTLEATERSAKIQQEGYALRGAAAAGKHSNNQSNESQEK